MNIEKVYRGGEAYEPQNIWEKIRDMLEHIKGPFTRVSCHWGCCEHSLDGSAKPGWVVVAENHRWSFRAGKIVTEIGRGLLTGNELKYTPTGGMEIVIPANNGIYGLAYCPEKDREVNDAFYGIARLVESKVSVEPKYMVGDENVSD